MAKDPAFLFYSNDFSTGTQFFSDEQVGQYLRLLMAEHQHGRLSEKQIKMICKSHDNEIMSKFKKDDAGLFYNERLEFEISKRKAYSESRSGNRKGKTKSHDGDINNISKSYDKHMENENEIEIEIENKKKNGAKIKKFVPPSISEVIEFFSSKGHDAYFAKEVFEHYALGDWKDSHGNQVVSWKQKMLTNWINKREKPASEPKGGTQDLLFPR